MSVLYLGTLRPYGKWIGRLLLHKFINLGRIYRTGDSETYVCTLHFESALRVVTFQSRRDVARQHCVRRVTHIQISFVLCFEGDAASAFDFPRVLFPFIDMIGSLPATAEWKQETMQDVSVLNRLSDIFLNFSKAQRLPNIHEGTINSPHTMQLYGFPPIFPLFDTLFVVDCDTTTEVENQRKINGGDVAIPNCWIT